MKMGRTSWRDAAFIVVDLETTGLDPARDEIISFAAIPVRDGRARPGEMVNLLVQPRRAPSATTIRIHGLRESDLADQPFLDDRLDAIEATLGDSILVAHCAWIETEFLEVALSGRGRRRLTPVVDTMELGRTVLNERGIPTSGSPSLAAVAKALGLPVHRPHHADGDALTTSQVFLALASLLRNDRDATVAELVQGRRRRWRPLSGIGVRRQPTTAASVSSGEDVSPSRARANRGDRESSLG